MEYGRIDVSQIDLLWELQRQYKLEIGEETPDEAARARLAAAILQGKIFFYGAWAGDALVGCCSVSASFSTFDYRPCGVFEDFFIRPEFRHQGIARHLVQFAWQSSGVSTMTVGCADCDVQMYASLGFSVPLGRLLAFEAQ